MDSMNGGKAEGAEDKAEDAAKLKGGKYYNEDDEDLKQAVVPEELRLSFVDSFIPIPMVISRIKINFYVMVTDVLITDKDETIDIIVECS